MADATPTGGNANDFRFWMRWAMVATCTAVTVFAISYGIATRDSADRTAVDTIEFNQPVQVAVEYGGETSRALMQMAVGLLAVLGGVLVAKADEAKLLLGAWQERLMFILAAVLLFASLVMFLWYSDGVMGACASGIAKSEQKAAKNGTVGESKDTKYQIPDVFGDRFEFSYVLQKWFFFSGIFVVVLMFVTAHGIKENKK